VDALPLRFSAIASVVIGIKEQFSPAPPRWQDNSFDPEGRAEIDDFSRNNWDMGGQVT
jgi:hypothetical protein